MQIGVPSGVARLHIGRPAYRDGGNHARAKQRRVIEGDIDDDQRHGSECVGRQRRRRGTLRVGSRLQQHVARAREAVGAAAPGDLRFVVAVRRALWIGRAEHDAAHR